MDAIAELHRFLSQRGAPSARALSLQLGVSSAYLAGVLNGRHGANYEVATALARMVFPDADDHEARQLFRTSLIARRSVVAA